MFYKGMSLDGRAALTEHDGGLIEVYGSGRAVLAQELARRYNAFEDMRGALQGCLDVLSQNHTFPADIAMARRRACDGLRAAGVKNPRPFDVREV